MQKGMYRAHRDDLGEECARIDIGDTAVEVYMTRATYTARGGEPGFDELPTEKQYLKQKS